MLEKDKIKATVSSSATTSNGISINKDFIETTTQIKTITSVESQTNAMKKKSKKNKNKSKNLTTINNEKNTPSCDNNISTKTIKSVTDDDIQAVSEDLLKQLKINGSLHKEIDTSSNDTENRADSAKSKQTAKKSPKKQANGANSGQKHFDGQSTSNNSYNKNHKNNSVATLHNESNHLSNEISHSNGVVLSESSAIEKLPKIDNAGTCNGVHLESDVSGQLTKNHALDAIACQMNDEQISMTLPSTSSAASTTIQTISSSQESPNIAELCSKQIPTDTSSTDSNTVKIELPSTPSETTSSLPSLSASTSASASSSSSSSEPKILPSDIRFIEYENELQMPDIMRVIQKDLSEPYSIYTYRYFIHNWPKLCFLAMHGDTCIGAIVCKLDIHRQMIKRGYIAMLAVDKDYRKLKVGTTLVQKAIHAMLEYNADEVVLETEITNIPALRLYENLGFVRDKRLFDYYLNGVDALRLKLWFK